MATVLIIDDDVSLLRMLQIMLERGGFQTILSSHGEDGIRKAVELHPDLAIIDVMMPDVSGHDVCRRLREDTRTADIPLLVLTARAQPVDRQAALGSGASDYLSKPVSPKVLIEKVRDLLNQPSPMTREGRVAAVLSLRGGTGATTLAVNLALQLITSKHGSVCVADLSPSGGHVALQLRQPPRSSWATYRPEPGTPSGDVLKRHIMAHDTGLSILASPAMPIVGAQGLSAALATSLMTELRKTFAWTVVDCAPVLDDATIAALSVADFVLIVMTADVASVQSTSNTVRAISGLGPAVDRAFVVLNQVSPQRGLPQAVLEKALGRTIAAAIPFDENQVVALSQGQPLTMTQPAAPLAKGAGDLMSLLLEQSKSPRVPA